MRRSVLAGLVIAACLPLCGSDAWPQEPDGFKGAKFGMTTAEIVAALGGRLACVDFHGVRCNQQIEVGDFKMEANYVFEDGKFASVFGSFPSNHFEDAKQVFVEKYGTVFTSKDVPLSNRMGAKFLNHQLAWEGDAAVVLIEKYGSTVDEGMFMVALKSFVDHDQQHQRDANKKALE